MQGIDLGVGVKQNSFFNGKKKKKKNHCLLNVPAFIPNVRVCVNTHISVCKFDCQELTAQEKCHISSQSYQLNIVLLSKYL